MGGEIMTKELITTLRRGRVLGVSTAKEIRDGID